MECAADVIREHLPDPAHSWSIGVPGAIGEFMYDADEPVALRSDGGEFEISTPRGAMRLAIADDTRCVAYLTQSPVSGTRSCAVSFCVPDGDAGATCTGITELGPDRAAIDEQARGDVLFDLGVGAAALRFCVRSGDAQILAALRAAAGRFAFDPAGPVVRAITAASPVRVIRSALGRIEIYQRIPDRNERSPRGPHTHLLPRLFGSDPGPVAAATPDGFIAALTLHPQHPEHDKYGAPVPFDQAAAEAIERLLSRFGSQEVPLQ